MTGLTAAPSWRALAAHCAKIEDVHLRTQFADDPDRAERFCAEGLGLFLDYSSAPSSPPLWARRSPSVLAH